MYTVHNSSYLFMNTVCSDFINLVTESENGASDVNGLFLGSKDNSDSGNV